MNTTRAFPHARGRRSILIATMLFVFGVVSGGEFASVGHADQHSNDTIAGAQASEPADVAEQADAQDQAETTEPEKPATPVRVVALRDVFVTAEHSAPAQVVSFNQAKISAEISARILELFVEVGDVVAVAQNLASLDCSDFDRARDEIRARIDVGRSRRRLAEQQLERTQKLVSTQALADDSLDRIQAEFDSATAEIAAQRASLARVDNQASRCVPNAPFAGVVTARPAQLGEYTSPGEVLYELVDTNNVELSAQIPDRLARSLTDVQQLRFSDGDIEYAVNLRTLLPVIHPTTKSREARLKFVTRPPVVGSVGRLLWTFSHASIPPDLVSQRDGRLGVILAVQDKARFYPIDGAQEGRPAAVKLNEHIMIITDGRHGLSDGDPIVVRD